MVKLTDYDLDKRAAKDSINSFVWVQARDFHRRQMNKVWPQIEAEFDLAIANGRAVDVPALLRQIFSDVELLGLD